jgi:CheY-like chemotaxis protein
VQRVVLIVDDNPGFRRFARRLLEEAGFEIAEAADGNEGLADVEAVRPDIVLLDVQLPDIDGFEVARRLASSANPPIVVLTSSREASDYGPRIASSPAAAFCPKAELTAAAMMALSRSDV